MVYLSDKTLKSFYFHKTTPDEIIEIIKSFSNSKSSSVTRNYDSLESRLPCPNSPVN